jgi:hypothetical protein
MTVFDVRLDPAAVAVNRTELQLNTGAIEVDEAGIDWGDAAIQEYLADAAIGSVPVGRRWPNRTVKLPLIVRAPNDTAAFSTAKQQVMQKVGQIQREGFGWLQRQPGLYADVIGATLTFPDRYGQRFGWENGVVLQLECSPDFYEDEVTLSTVAATGVCDAVLMAIGNGVPNPSFEHDTVGSASAGWVTTGLGAMNAGATITTQTLAGAPGGSKSGRIITTSASALQGAGIFMPGTFVAGQPYVVSAYMRGNVGGETVALGAADSTVGDAQATASIALTTTFTRHNFTYTPAATHTNMYVFADSTAAAAMTFFIDDVMVTAGATLQPYVDGDTAGNQWAGTAGNSITLHQAVIDGAQDARCRIIVTDTSGNAQNGVWWGVRSQYYDSATTAKAFYEAEALTLINGSSAHAHTGMSGGTTVMNSLLPAQDWLSVLVTDLAAGNQLTHRGSYRVIARAYSATAAPSLRLQWGAGNAANLVTNPQIALPGSGTAYEVDLGVVRIDAPPVGDLAWRGLIEAFATTAGDPIEIDRITLMPVAESAGAVNKEPGTQASVNTSARPFGAGASSGSGAAWTAFGGVWRVLSLSAGTSQVLKLTGFGFALPATATVLGIEVDAARFGSGDPVTDTTVKLLKAGTAVGNNKASAVPWPNLSATVATFGTSTDLWGTTWAASDINNANFGVEFVAQCAGNSEAWFTSNPVTITVSYILGSGFSAATSRALYADQTVEIRTDGVFNTSDGTVYGEIVPNGDLPRIPASGVEQRPCELIVVTSEGNLITTSPDDPTQPSPAFDSFSVQVKYRPCWPFAP